MASEIYTISEDTMKQICDTVRAIAGDTTARSMTDVINFLNTYKYTANAASYCANSSCKNYNKWFIVGTTDTLLYINGGPITVR